MEQISDGEWAHLAEQFKIGRPILFTGAGFSLGVKNILGKRLPTFSELKTGLWNICFPDDDEDPDSSVQDIYDVALSKKYSTLKRYICEELTVDSDSIPDWYKQIFNFPWYKAYTLNIDDLDQALNRKFKLERRIMPISGTSDKSIPNIDLRGAETLKSIHLNGTLEDVPEHSTFSTTQYASRQSKQDPWYTNFVNELLVYPVVFIGTTLNEPSLWKHIELKSKKSVRGEKEHRSKSYLVTKNLNAARKGLLSLYNVVHIDMTAEEFELEVRSRMSTSLAEGLAFISRNRYDSSTTSDIKLVSDLLINLNKRTDYFLGAYPHWSDIHSLRSIIRVSDESILMECQNRLSKKSNPGVIALTGTAGCGKSSALMRVAYSLNASGKRVGWIDQDSEYNTFLIKKRIEDKDFDVLCIDDSENIGMELTSLILEISNSDTPPLLILAISSAKIDRLVNPKQFEKFPYGEITVPPLQDRDIDSLLSSLKKESRLGILTDKPYEYQFSVFQKEAGRILLAAMIKATSGEELHSKLLRELGELEPIQQRIYSLLVVSTHAGYGLTRPDILAGVNGESNSILEALDKLVSRHMVNITGTDVLQHRALNKILAESIFNKMANTPEMYANLVSIGIICAANIHHGMKSNSKYKNLLKRVVNHNYLKANLGPQKSLEFFEALDEYPVIRDDEHYWLQRGALEVEIGNLSKANFYLTQALAIQPHSLIIKNEFAYLNFRTAIENPADSISMDLVSEAIKSLLYSISKRPNDPTPFGIIGTQGLIWAKIAYSNTRLKKDFLHYLREVIEPAAVSFPKNREINDARDAILREYLLDE